ncbi:conserved domain protein [Limosilactobacillus oris F0423]|uniref:Conserved domain protein n=1 Tax=Limosilactobacillus oris F0423 TaxID=944562 RepID=A0ABN0D5X4_9LACO|nr:hypothetical protein [Limosilactobacillus oris]EGS37921.1 conserved domain protein [Limosilactobacillus oris F0423]
MTNEQYAKNGQLVYAVKNYSELTKFEKKELIIPAGDSLEDYANYQVRYNKKGQLLGVKPNDFSAKKNAELDMKAKEPDLLDGLAALSSSKHTKIYQQAKKRLGVTNEQVNRARAIVSMEVSRND